VSVATTDVARTAAAHLPTAGGEAVVLALPAVTDDDGRPSLRLLPAPPCEPPYDDELPAARRLHAVPGRAAHRTAGATAPATALEPPPVLLRLVPRTSRGPAALAAFDDDDECRPRTPLAQLPASRPFARALVQRLLEVLAGLRPVSQLQRDTSFELFTELEQALVGRARPAGPRPTGRDVRSVHVQESADGVAEVCATVHRGGRMTALALRLEGVDGAWRCTALLGV
jgi:hypothetical protein